MKKILLALMLALMLAALPALAETAQFEFVTDAAAPGSAESRIDAWIEENDLEDYVTEEARQALITIVEAIEAGSAVAGPKLAEAFAVLIKWARTAPSQAKQAIEMFIETPEVQEFIASASQTGAEFAEEFSQLAEEFGEVFGEFADVAGEALGELGDAVGELFGSLFG